MSLVYLPNKMDIINQSMAAQNGQLRDQSTQHIRVIYRSNTQYIQNHYDQKNILEVYLYSRCPQQATIIEQGQTPIDLDDEREIFTIGKLEKETLDLDHIYKNFKAEINFNEVVIPEHVLSYIHLEVNYRSLKKIKKLQDDDASIKSIIAKVIARQILPQKVVEELSYFLNNRQIRISDISKKKGCPTLIEITQNCEQKILKAQRTYRIGQDPKLVVQRNFGSLELFFKKYNTSSELDLSNFVFNALFKLQEKIEFLGVEHELAKLLMQIQTRVINKNDFSQKMSDENYKIQIQLQNCFQKSCIWIELWNNNNSSNKQNFLLVADVKTIFTFGRSKSNDLIYTSNQVSRLQGQIQYNSSQGTWKIIDGYLDMNEWRSSRFGIWLEMEPEIHYFVDLEQKVKLGNHLIQFMLKEKESPLLEIDDEETIDDFVKTQFSL